MTFQRENTGWEGLVELVLASGQGKVQEAGEGDWHG